MSRQNINELAAQLRQQATQEAAQKRAQEAASRASSARATEAAMQAAGEIRSLCEKFRRWAIRHRIPTTGLLWGRGWELINLSWDTYDGSTTGHTWTSKRIFVPIRGQIKVSSGYRAARTPWYFHYDGFTLSEVETAIARFVTPSRPWDE